MAAGEFGQMVIADTGGPVTHDRPGCLEMLASDEATVRRYYSGNGASRRPAAGDLSAHVKRICHLAMAGEEKAVEALRGSARYLGVGISNLIWGLDPDSVVIDGTITEAWPLVLPVIQDQFANGGEFLNFRNLVVRPSALGGEAVIIGATALPFQNLFNTSEHARM
jgi:predicted NBD/HSP70 family sugar kinase